VLEETRVGRAGLHHRAIGRQVAAQHGQCTAAADGLVQRADHRVVQHLGVGDVLAQAAAGDGQLAQRQLRLDALHQRRQAPGVVEVLHQPVAAGEQVGQHRHPARHRVQVVQAQCHASTARHRDDVHRGVGRAAQRHLHRRSVEKGAAAEDARRPEVVPDHADDALAAIGGHARVGGVHRRDRGAAWQRQAQRLDQRGHGAGRAHGVAGAGAARHLGFERDPLRLVDAAGLVLVPEHAGMGAGADLAGDAGLHLTVVEHRPGGAEDHRHAHADGAHHRAGGRLVAAGQQHHAVDRVAAQQFFHFHRQEVAVEHGGRLDDHLAQAHGRQFDRETTGQQHAALDRFGPLAQVRVAGRQVAPGVDDADDRPLHHVLAAHAHLLQPLAVREAAHAGIGEPAAAAQLGQRLARCGRRVAGRLFGFVPHVGHVCYR